MPLQWTKTVKYGSGRMRGISRFDGFPGRVGYRNSGLPSDDVVRSLRASMNIWAGTLKGGVFGYTGVLWRSYNAFDGLASNNITSVSSDNSGYVWFGTRGGGISTLRDGEFITFTTSDGLGSDMVRSLSAVSPGRVWVGTDRGVSFYDGGWWRNHTKGDSLSLKDVLAVASDGGNGVWVGTNGSGAAYFDGKSWTGYTTRDGLASDVVTCIALDRGGTVWFGSPDRGLTSFSFGKWRTYTTADSLADNHITALAVGRDYSLWVGTPKGASHLEESTWKTYPLPLGKETKPVPAAR